MTLGLEPCNRYETHLVNTAEQAVRLIERIGEPNVMIHLDTYHMNIEEKGFAHGIRSAGEHLRYIHLSESDRGVPGTGTVDWDATFAALAETGLRRRHGDRILRHPAARDRPSALGLAAGRGFGRAGAGEGVPFLRDLAQKHGLLES